MYDRTYTELIEAGIYSLKIEGRMKSSYYVATIVKSYRQAIDKYLSDPQGYKFEKNGLIICVKQVTDSIIPDFIFVKRISRFMKRHHMSGIMI